MSINLSEMLESNRTNGRGLTKSMFETTEQFTAFNATIGKLYADVEKLHFVEWSAKNNKDDAHITEAKNVCYQDLRDIFALCGFIVDGKQVKLRPVANELDCLMSYTTKFVWVYTEEYKKVKNALEHCDVLISWLTEVKGDTSKFNEQKSVLLQEKERLETTTVYRKKVPEFVSKGTFANNFSRHLDWRLREEVMKTPEQRAEERAKIAEERKARRSAKKAEEEAIKGVKEQPAA